MQIVVTNLGSNGTGAVGTVNFYRGGDLVHTERFEGLILSGEYRRTVEVDLSGTRAEFVTETGQFEGFIDNGQETRD